MPSEKELIINEIELYTKLLKIKAANKEDNPILEYEIRISKAKLDSLGVNTDDLQP